MPIVVQCKCGKKMKVRETSAGKRVKCVECGGPVKVPESAHNDDYGADSYDDGASSSAAYGSPPPRKKAASKKKKPAKSSDSNSRLALMIVGGAVLGLVLVGGALWALLGGGGSAAPEAANVAASDSPAADGGETATNSTPETDTASTIAATSPAATSPGTDPATQTDASAVAATETPATPPTAATPTAATPVAMPTGEAANLWIVLSDFQEIPGGNGINKNYQISYRIAAGKPDPAQQYELYYGASMGSVMERYNVVPVLLQPTGTIQVPTGLGMSGNLRAYLGRKTGRQEWEPVSGEINPGGPPTSDRRPPTVVEAAGADAAGKVVVLANPRFENSRLGGNAFVVDYVLQQPLDNSKRYVLVIQGQGDSVRSDVTNSLINAVQGKKDLFGVRTVGPGAFPEGPLTAHIEARVGMISRQAPDIISNSVTLQR